MALTNEQIIDSLLQFYKSRGTDLTYFLLDPVFDKMNASDKVEAIKRHAATIYHGSPAGYNREEKMDLAFDTGSSILGGAVSGLVVGVAAKKAITEIGVANTLANTMALNKALAATIRAAALTGAIGGGILAYRSAKKSADSRLALRNQLGKTALNPSTTNAIGALSIRGQFERENAPTNKLIDRIGNALGENLSKVNNEHGQNYYNEKYLDYGGQAPRPR